MSSLKNILINLITDVLIPSVKFILIPFRVTFFLLIVPLGIIYDVITGKNKSND